MQQNRNTAQHIIVFKYGGNAMTDEKLKREVLQTICALTDNGYRVVIVHGGGHLSNRHFQKPAYNQNSLTGSEKRHPKHCNWLR